MKNNILYCLARSPTENRFYLIDSSHVTSLQRGARSAPPVGHTRPRNGLHQGVTKLNLLQPRLVSSSGLPRQSPFALALSSPTTIPAPGPSIAGRNQSSLPSSPFSPYPHPDRRRHLPPTYKIERFRNRQPHPTCRTRASRRPTPSSREFGTTPLAVSTDLLSSSTRYEYRRCILAAGNVDAFLRLSGANGLAG